MTPVRSYDELVARQAEAAIRISGAHHSSWNHRTVLTTGEDKVAGHRGIAGWEGTIRYDEERVVGQLREMFRNAGRQQDAEALQGYRGALRIMLHENSHLLAAAGTDHQDAHDLFQSPTVRALDEGVTEAWSFAHLDEYVDELGLDQVAPGIKGVATRRAYPRFGPAAKSLADGIGEIARLDGDEVLRRMNVVNAAGKWTVATDLVYEHSRLPELLRGREDEAALAKLHIADAMRTPFSDLDQLSDKDWTDQVIESDSAGKAAVRAARDKVAELERVYGGGGDAPVMEQRLERPDGRGPAEPAYTDGLRARRLGTEAVAPLTGARPIGGGERAAARDRDGDGRDPGRDRE
ncbi:MAG TPA: hypothetical protein VGJ44_13225 [Kribbellaceae bacterium]